MTRMVALPHRSPGGILVGAILSFCLLVLGADSARAQLMHLDPLPYFAAADSTSRLALVVDVDRFADTKFDWQVNRLQLSVILPAGEDATFFVRMPYLSFDKGPVSLAGRWPWVLADPAVGTDTGSAAVVEGGLPWPYENRSSGFGKIEAGVTGPLTVPLLQRTDFGLALGLPTGTDRQYPLSARSIPFRFQIRKPVALRQGLQLRLLAGYLVHMDSGGEELVPEAFPSGYQLGAALAKFGSAGREWTLAWDARNEDSRRSQIVSLQGWLHWTADSSIGLRVGREIQGSLDRPANWYFSLSWRFDSASHRPGREARAEPSQARTPRR